MYGWEKLWPYWLWHLQNALTSINSMRSQSVGSVRLSHVKWHDHDVVFSAFALFDRVMRWLVKVSHASEWPACCRLTWHIPIDNELWGRTALVGIDVWYNHQGGEGKSWCYPSMFKWVQQVVTLPRIRRKCLRQCGPNQTVITLVVWECLFQHLFTLEQAQLTSGVFWKRWSLII